MPGVLAQQRQQIADALKAAGLHAFTIVPEKWTPPGVFVGPGDPYITREGAAFGGEVVNLAVTVVAARGTNDVRANELDDLVLRTLDVLYGLDEHGFGVGDVARPGSVAINSQTHLGTSIAIATEIHR
jgi:hypothetical protein